MKLKIQDSIKVTILLDNPNSYYLKYIIDKYYNYICEQCNISEIVYTTTKDNSYKWYHISI